MQNLGAWKPMFLCKGRADVAEPSRRSKLQRESVSEDKSSEIQQGTVHDETVASPSQLSTKSSSHLNAQIEFLKATAQAAVDVFFSTHHEIPDLDEAYAKFKAIYPKFLTTEKIEELRLDEYYHLEQQSRKKVCLDYCGFGLFSHTQAEHSSFGPSQISVNLRSHALNGPSSSLEKDLRNRIMEFLNIPATEYSMVFTVNRGSAFKLLAETYPFHQNRRLLTMYDYDSQSVNWMAEIARNKGAKVRSACFRWPSLRACSAELKKELKHKKIRRKDSAVGMFVFPFQSRVTGTKYSSQWMALAQQNGWHVLLDAGALGPKDMDSLGLSLFRPDFIITSFYKVFGEDPTGFGCLFIKNSAMACLEDHDGGASVGMVSILPAYSIDSADEEDSKRSEEGDEEIKIGPQMELSAFSGPFSSLQVSNDFESEVGSSFRDGASEDIDNASTLKSPIFSEDENDNLFCIDLGQSPLATGPLRKGNSGHLPHKSTYKNLLTRSPRSPLYDEGNIDSSMVSSDAPVSSQLDLSKDCADGPTLDAETRHPLHELEDQNTNGKCHKFLDPGYSPSKEQEKVQRNGISVLHGPDGGLDLISEDDIESTGRISSKRFSKQSKLSFIPENAEAERGEITPTQGKLLESTCHEIAIYNEDTKSSSTSGKQIISNGTTGLKNRDLKVGKRVNHVMNESPQLSRTKENAIRRETEGEFRLLGRRETGRLLDLDAIDRINSMGRRESSSMEEGGGKEAYFLEETGPANQRDDEGMSDAEVAEEQREPGILCKHLDHVDSMGLNRTTLRLRYLIHWLVTSLLQLRHPGPDGGFALVHIYGPKVKYDRGAAVAFNLYDCKGGLVPPEIVQRLADKNNIALGLGFLSHLRFMENPYELQDAVDSDDNSLCKAIVNGRWEGKRVSLRVEVVTASLGFLSNFEDVYRMWAFVAKFLDTEYSETQGWQSQSGPA